MKKSKIKRMLPLSWLDCNGDIFPSRIEYVKNDPTARVILTYTESFSDPQTFCTIAEDVSGNINSPIEAYYFEDIIHRSSIFV